ncbi:MAG: DUF4062 domain-containing protein, partial [Promethearchaeota archaeon]
MKDSYRCSKCGHYFSEDLINKLSKSKEIICEKCGTPFSLRRNKKIFISHTSELFDLVNDLKDEITSLKYEPVWYEGRFDLSNVNDVMEGCRSNIRQSGFFILLLDKTAGSLIDQDNQTSIIEWEVQIAHNNNKRIIVFIRDQVFDQIETYEKQSQKAFFGQDFKDLGFTAEKNVYELILNIKYIENPKVWICKFNNVNDIIEEIKDKWMLYESKGKSQLQKSISQLQKTSIIRIYKNKNIKNDDGEIPLPNPIESSSNPSTWIKSFKSQFTSILKPTQYKEELESRFLKLACGTRGLHQYDLKDSLLAVPPLDSVIEPIQQELIEKTGKFGVFAKPGMGKSRTLLYLAHWWIEMSPEAMAILISEPFRLLDNHWNVLEEILISSSNKILLIFDDVHNIIGEKRLQNLIVDAGPNSYSLVIGFTEQISLKFKEQSRWLKDNILPLNYNDFPTLNDTWSEWRTYFFEWMHWMAKFVLDSDSLQTWKQKFNRRNKEQILSKYQSPFSVVITLGYLKQKLEGFLKEYKYSVIKRLLYPIIAFLFILKGERSITQSQLLGFLESFIGSEELANELKGDWKQEINLLIKTLIDPPYRLLPPLRKQEVPGKIIETETVIDFYHREWAIIVLEKLLESPNSDLHEVINKLFEKSLPNLTNIWKILTEKMENFPCLIKWFITYVEFSLDENGKYKTTSLDLSNNNLTKVPISLTELKDLKSLYLQNNKLQSLPRSISKMKNLVELNIDNNQLEEIPDSLNSLENLQNLFLENNILKVLPEKLKNLSNLKYLDLTQNNLSNLPNDICYLSSLKFLRVTYNNLKSLPKEFKNLTNLITLHLGGNKFSKFPKSIKYLTNLENLVFNYNNLNSIQNLENLENLKELNLEFNHIESLSKKFLNFESNFLNLPNLEFLTLACNELNSLPEDFGVLENLKSLELSDNNLKNLPESLGQLKNLESLNLNKNKLIFLPNNFNNLQNLKSLKLQHNHLNSFPTSILELKNLERLYLKGNPIRYLPKIDKNIENLIQDNLNISKIKKFSNEGNLNQLFQRIIPEIFIPEKARRYTGLIQFIIRGDLPQAIYIDKGKLTIKNEIGKDPSICIKVNKELLLAIARGMIH